MNGTATVEIAPTLPDFSARHATKKGAHPSITNPHTFMPSQQILATYPIQYAPPPQYYSPYMTSEFSSISNFNNLPSSELPVPSIEEFLKKLDKDEGDNGDYIQFIEAFNEQKTTVRHIKYLSDNDFRELGVNTIGWRKTIQAAARQYNN
jgi:SAM domain (Sterile alpha motif)